MKPKTRLLLAILVVAAMMALSQLRRDQQPVTLAASYTGVAQITGPLQLDLSVTPPVGTPRDTLRLVATLTNNQATFASPNVILTIPPVLRTDTAALPSGVTMNLANNSVQWLPVVSPNGGSRTLALDLKVSSADLTHPEQRLDVLLRTNTDDQESSTTLWIGVPPTVTDFAGPMRIAVGQPLDLQALVQGPGPFTESWDLGDGRQVDVNSPTVVYPVAGVYDLSVTVKNPLGSAGRTGQITVVPHAAAAFAAEDDTVAIDEPVRFANLSGGEGPLQYHWDFGDGNASEDAHPQHSYARPGTYVVKLVAENSFGRSERTESITVGTPPPADIVVAELAAAGQRISGSANSITAETQYAWSMGDGRLYEGSKVSHAYRQQGDYYVTLKATNDFGSTEVGRWVRVEPGTLQVFLPLVSNRAGLLSGSSAQAAALPAGIEPGEELALTQPFEMAPQIFDAGTTPTMQLLSYINIARAQFDLSPLTAVTELSAAAQKHTADMAAAGHTQHVGSDGSTPRDRFLQFAYPRGYAGEATAWGFADPRQAVQFWVNSPGHRPIILNPYATEVGLGYTAAYDAPSVWYWTAEFGNGGGAPEAPSLRLQSPGDGLEALNSDTLVFSWNWPQALAATEQFSIYFSGSSGRTAVATVKQPNLGTKYVVTLQPLNRPDLIGPYTWQVVLENNRGAQVLASESRSLAIAIDPDLPTPTPVPTAVPTLLPTPTITPTGQPTVTAPAPTAAPPEPTLPPLIIATPLPTPEP